MAMRFTFLVDDSRDVFEERSKAAEKKQTKKTRQTLINLASGLMGLAPVVMEMLKRPSRPISFGNDKDDDDETPVVTVVGADIPKPKSAEVPKPAEPLNVKLPVESYASFKEKMDRRQKAMDALFKLPLSAPSAAELFMAFCRLSYSDRADVFDFLAHSSKEEILSALLGAGISPEMIAQIVGLAGIEHSATEASSGWGDTWGDEDLDEKCPDCGGTIEPDDADRSFRDEGIADPSATTPGINASTLGIKTRKKKDPKSS